MLKYATVLSLAFSSAAYGQSVQQAMPFSACVTSLQTAPAGATQPPVTTIDTDQVKEVRVPVTDGQVTINCNAATQQATMTHSGQ